MIRFNQFDISDVFNEIQSPLLIFDSEEILFFNSYFKNNFKSISEVWREVVEDSELVKSLDGFFESGAVPMTTEIPQLKPKISDSYYYEWTFTNLPSSYSDRFLIVLGHGVKKVSENSNQKSIPKEGYLRSEEKYRTLVEESTEIIFSLSDTLNIDYISPNINQFVGYEAEAVIGTSIIDYLNPEDLDAFQSVVGDVNDFLAENQYLEFRIKHINGEYRVFGSNGRMVLERETNRRLYIGVARDITELKQIQKDLFHAKEKAEQASMAKSQFLSIMSHEIRTPMNAVIGLAHLLMDDNPRPDQMENLKTLQFSAENLMELINDILDFTKIESGKIELEQASLDLREIVNRIVHSYSFQAKEKGLFISTEIDGEIPHRLKGDSVRISQMLNNLLSNAIKFTAKGHVKVILKQVALHGEACQINFKIEDTGIGIPKDKMSSIFEAFTQASSSTTRKFGGTGLGLAIVKRLVELHESKIQVTSSPGVGTIFDFTLNFICVEKTSYAQSKELEPNTKSLQQAAILVAEDNLVNQILIKKFLNKWQVGNLVIASDGQEAIIRFEEGQFDLILLDIQMPEMDGFEVARRIRQHEDSSKNKTPILILSATSFHEIKDEMMESGINDFIEKPFSPDGLYTKLTEYLNWKEED